MTPTLRKTMKKTALVFFPILVMMFLSSCAGRPANTHMNVYSGSDKGSALVSTEDKNVILKMLDIMNNYEQTTETVNVDSPDYTVELKPVNKDNGSELYSIWIRKDKILLLPPKLFDEPARLSISKRSFRDFEKIIRNKNEPG